MKSQLKKALDPAEFRARSHQLVDLLTDYFEKIQESSSMPVLDWAPSEGTVEKGHQNLTDTNPSTASLFKEILKDSIHIHHPHFMGHQLSSVAPLAAAASLLTDL